MKLSLCVICKDEELKIKRCIQSVMGIVDEIIVVDTGSSDKTILRAKEEGAIVYNYMWENNFSTARNYAIEKATGDWIIFLDADEYCSEECVKYIRPVILDCIKSSVDLPYIQFINLGDNGVTDVMKHIRIFKRTKEIFYEGKIHEKLMHKNRRLRGIDASDKITILHDGYTKQEIKNKDKINRNIKMLEEELEDDYSDSDAHFYLVECYEVLNEQEKVLKHLLAAINYNRFSALGTKQVAYSKLLKFYLSNDVEMNQLQQYYEAAIKVDSMFPDYEWYFGLSLLQQNQHEEGVFHLEECINKANRYNGEISSEITLKIDTVFHILADEYIKQGIIDKALFKLVQLIKADKYDYKALYKLLKILRDVEKSEKVISFLGNIYDIKLSKDKFTILNISKKLGYLEIYNYYYEKLTPEEKIMF